MHVLAVVIATQQIALEESDSLDCRLFYFLH